MKLYEIADELPIQYLLLKKQVEKGQVFCHMWADDEGSKALITDVEFRRDHEKSTDFIWVRFQDYEVDDDEVLGNVDTQRFYPAVWDRMILTNNYSQGKMGEWWLVVEDDIYEAE